MLAARHLRPKGTLKLNEYQGLPLQPTADGTPIRVWVDTRAKTGKDEWNHQRFLGPGIAIGQIVDGEDRMLVITVQDPTAPGGKVDLLGSEVWWVDARTPAHAKAPDAGAYEYALSLEASPKPDPVLAPASIPMPVLPTALA